MPLTETGAILLGAGLSSAGSVASTGIAGARNMKLARYANKKNIEQWQRELAYNDPSAQMERLRAAGLNPHLVYGGSGGSAAGNSSVGSPETVTYQTDIPNILGEGLRAYMDLKSLSNDTDKTKSDIQTARVNDAFTIQSTLNKQAEHNNILAQNDIFREQLTNIMENTKLAKLNQISIQIANAKNEEERKRLLERYEHEKVMQTYQVQAAEANLRSMALNDLYTQRQTEKVGFEIGNMIKDGKLKDLTADEKSLGLEKDTFRWNQGSDRFSGAAAMAVDGATAITRAINDAYQKSKLKSYFDSHKKK